MSVYAGPEFNESGVVFYYDMNNKKSYVGAPTTNLVPSADTMPGWTTYSYGTPVAFQTEFGTTGYRLTNAPSWNGIYRTVTVPSTGTYTFSVWIRYLGGSPNNNGGTVYISGWGGSDTNTAVNKNIIGQWQRVTRTLTVTTTSMTFYIISYGGTNDGNSDRSSWEITMPQLEAGSVATTFVNGTRSSTQVLRDLLGNHTITANSLTYNTDGSFELGASGNDYISVAPAALNGLTSWTIDFWLQRNTTNGIDTFLTCGAGNDFLWFFQAGDNTVQYQNPGGSQITSYFITNGVPFNFTATGSGGSISVYKNGELVGTMSNTTTITVGSTIGIILGQEMDSQAGTFDANQSFKGKIYSAKFYNRPLTAAEIYQNFTALRLRYGI
jgi:hypothetical protein